MRRPGDGVKTICRSLLHAGGLSFNESHPSLTLSKGTSLNLRGPVMQANSPDTSAPTGTGAAPPRQLADALAEGFDTAHASIYASRLLGAFPATIKARNPGMAWQSA